MRVLCSLVILLGILVTGGYAEDPVIGSMTDTSVTASSSSPIPGAVAAKITVIGKRLPSRFGMAAATFPYQVYHGEITDTGAGHARTVGDVLERIDGVRQYSMSTSEVDQMIAIGGFNDNKYVTVLVDGVKYNAEDDALYMYWLPLSSIGSYEVIKGADSSVYGSGGFGGTIHLYREQDIRPFVKVEAGGLGYGMQSAGTSWAAGPFYGTVVADHKAADGYRKNSSYDLSGVDVLQGVYLNQARTHSLEVGYQTAFGNTYYPDVLNDDELAGNPQSSVAGDQRRSQAEISVVRYHGMLFSDLNLQMNVYHKNNAVNYSGVGRAGTGTRTFSMMTADGMTGQLDYKKNMFFSDETWTIGFDTELGALHYKRYGLDLENWVKTTKEADLSSERTNTGYFLSYAGTIAERFVLDAGGRQDTVHYDLYRTMAYDQTTWPAATLLGRYFETEEFQVRTHHAGLFWKLIEDNGVFVNYRQGFRAPSYFEMYDISGWSGNNNVKTLDPERAYTTEVGTRWRFAGEMTMRFSVYETLLQDEIVYFSDPITWKGYNENVQESRRNGTEFAVDQKFSSDLQAHIGYSTCHAVFLDSIGNDLNGKTVPLVPEEEWRLGVDWRFIPENVLSLQHMIIGRQYLLSDTTNDYDQMSAYGRTDMKYTRTFDENEAYVMISNLFNTIYSSYGLVAWPGTRYAMPADPRSVNVGMKITF